MTILMRRALPEGRNRQASPVETRCIGSTYHLTDMARWQKEDLGNYPTGVKLHRAYISKRSDPAHKKGLRTVATIELSKGVVAVAFAFGLLALLHKDLWDIAQGVFEFLHINPDRHFAQTVLDLADRITDQQL